MKILLLDDHALFRAGLRLLLATVSADAVSFEAATLAEAERIVEREPELDVCLLDLSLKAESGHAALARLKELAPGMAVVVVSGADDAATIRACLDAGAMSFIPKTLGPEVLTQALQHVVAGTVYLPEHLLAAEKAAEPRPVLTPRQKQVLLLLSRGLPTKLIARELSLSEHTVKEHITLVFQALGARNRTDAVIKGSRLHLTDAPLA